MSDKKSLLHKLVSLLGSVKLSFVLMSLMGLLLAQKAIILQKFYYIGETSWFLRLTNSLGFVSPEQIDIPFFIVLGVFALNLVFSSFKMWRKIVAKRKGVSAFRGTETIRSLGNSAEISLPAGSLGQVESFFRANRFSVRRDDTTEGEVRLHAGRNAFGYWGVYLFHLTFFIVLIGSLLSFMTRYAGSFDLSPGEEFIDKHDNYRITTKVPTLLGTDREFKIKLDDMRLSYYKRGGLKEIFSKISVFDRSGEFSQQVDVSVNSPQNIIEGMTLYQGTRHGLLAVLEAEDTKGTVAPGNVKFKIPTNPAEPMKAMVNLPGTNLMIALELFTERLAAIEGLEEYGSKHMATLMKLTGYNGHLGVIFLGGELEFEGITLRFKELKPFTALIVVRDYGVRVIFLGFVVLLIGLIIIYFMVPENYWVAIRREGKRDIVSIGAVRDKYGESFKEIFKAEILRLQKEALE